MTPKTILLTGIGILIAALIAEVVLTRNIKNKLVKALMTENYKEYDQVRNRKSTLVLINRVNLLFLDLNKEMMCGNSFEVNEIINKFEKINASSRQKEEVYAKAFYYFLSVEDTDAAGKYYEKLEALNSQLIGKGLDVLYDTFVKGGSKYLNQQLKKLESENDPRQKMGILSVVAKMYENSGDEENKIKYQKLAQNLIKESK